MYGYYRVIAGSRKRARQWIMALPINEEDAEMSRYETAGNMLKNAGIRLQVAMISPWQGNCEIISEIGLP